MLSIKRLILYELKIPDDIYKLSNQVVVDNGHCTSFVLKLESMLSVHSDILLPFFNCSESRYMVKKIDNDSLLWNWELAR